MKTDRLTSDQDTLATSGNRPHTDRIDRITTGSGSDNFQPETGDKSLDVRRLQSFEAAGLEKNLSGADPVDLIPFKMKMFLDGRFYSSGKNRIRMESFNSAGVDEGSERVDCANAASGKSCQRTS